MAVNNEINLEDLMAGGAVTEAAPKATPKAAEATKPARKGSVTSQIVSDAEIAQHTAGVEVGSLSPTIEFVCSLGDPSVTDSYTIKTGENMEDRKASKIVGYRFRALEDIERVPDFGTTPNFSGNRLMDAADLTNYRSVAKDEIFDLTRVEVAALLTRPEYNMAISGGETPVRLSLSFKKVNPNAPVKSVADLPSAQLQIDGNGSIKDFPIMDVLTYESNATEESRFAVGTRTMKPEFADTKFANLAKTGTRTGRRGGGAAKDNADKKKQTRLENGAAFQKLLAGLAG